MRTVLVVVLTLLFAQPPAPLAFGQEAFAGHRFVFVLHEDKGHPHVHFAVALKIKGKKLDPRKQTLHRWRELWAEKARDRTWDALEAMTSKVTGEALDRQAALSPKATTDKHRCHILQPFSGATWRGA